MEIVNIEQLMRNKLVECDEWLNGKDEAIARLDEARIAYEKAQEDVAQYTDEYIAEVVSYRDDLKSKLGIVDEVVEIEEVVEVHDEQVVECQGVENTTDEIVEHSLV